MKNKLQTLIRFDFVNLLVLAVVSGFFVFLDMGKNGFGLDEAYSIQISKNLPSLFATMWYKEANMWLFYLILHYWEKFGASEVTIRGLSGLFSILSVLVIYKIGDLIKSKTVGIMAGLLLSVNMLFVMYAQYARAYAFMLFITCLSSYLFIKLGKKSGSKFLFIITSVVSLYVHFFAVFTLFSQVVTAFTTGRFKKFAISFLIITILFLPLIIAPSIHSSQVNWIVKPRLTSIAGTAFALTGDFPPLFVAYVIILLSFIPFLLKHIKEFEYNYLILLLIIPVIACFSISLIDKPIYQSTYFVAGLIPITLLSSVSITRFKSRAQLLIMGVLITLSVVRLTMWYSQNLNYKWIITNASDDFRGAEKYVSSHAKKDDVVVFYGYYAEIPFEFYNNYKIKTVSLTTRNYDLGGGSKLPDPEVKRINNLRNNTVWLVANRYTGSLFDRKEQFAFVEAELSKTHSHPINKQFVGVKVEEFDK